MRATRHAIIAASCLLATLHLLCCNAAVMVTSPMVGQLLRMSLARLPAASTAFAANAQTIARAFLCHTHGQFPGLYIARHVMARSIWLLLLLPCPPARLNPGPPASPTYTTVMACKRFRRQGSDTMAAVFRELSAKSSMLSMSTAVTSANGSQLSLPRTTRSSMAYTFVGAHERAAPPVEPTPVQRGGGGSSSHRKKSSRMGATLRSAAGFLKKLCTPMTVRSGAKSPNRPCDTTAQTKRSAGKSAKWPVYRRKLRFRGRSVAFLADSTASAPVMSSSAVASGDGTGHNEDGHAAEASCFCALHGAVSTAFEHHPCCPLVNDASIASLAAGWPDNASTSAPPELVQMSSRRSISAAGLAERLRVWKPRGHRFHARSHSQPSIVQSHRRNVQLLTAYYNDSAGTRPWTDAAAPAPSSAPASPRRRRGGSLDLPRTAELFHALPVKAQRQLFSPEERLVLTGRPDDAPLRRRPSQYRLDEQAIFSDQYSLDDIAVDMDAAEAEETGVQQQPLPPVHQYRRNRSAIIMDGQPSPSRGIQAALAFNRRHTTATAATPSDALLTAAHRPHASNLSDRHYHYNDSRVRRLLRRFRSRQRFDEMLWFGFAGEEEGEGRTLTVRVTLTPDMLQSL
ncbi:hypothetical protein SYNPS1DRAFT_26808 [Syncephalis pseudoplumigaleata]|uniref:Uncharacterized protein n=1 Tax=Syncephalis pseudoplumigaleata TaxID=1712513 RepID=A0A4P9Z526_9FUNG|nr:hypothetical protein SYNPS1DRAFT_26808 [Syncephalis pseudoplumigaleata]|eukprot:RKP27538.1 hypothetical protein SYNPS1DRAFT_26808 [Syncephalis pseudoplumigaleata]